MFNREAGARLWWRIACLGAVAGLRSMMAPAVVARSLAQHSPGRRRNLITRTMARPWVARGLGFAAAVEVAADKLPFIPARIAAMPLVARALWGALAGVAWIGERRPSRLVGAAALGATAAVATSYGGHQLRARLTANRGHVANALAGLGEDLLAGGLARVAQGRAFNR